MSVRGIAVPSAVATSFALAVQACSLTSTLDGLSSGGGPPPAEAGSGVDADAAPVDAGVVDDAAQPFRCEGRAAVFCADFELVPFPMPFEDVSEEMGGDVMEGSGLSGRGLVAQAPARSASGRGGPAVAEARTSMGVTQDFTVSYDVKLDRVTGAGDVLLPLFYDYEPFYIATILVDDAGRCQLHEYADGTPMLPLLSRERELARCLAADTWTHVGMSVKFVDGVATARLTLDGALAFEGAIDAGRTPAGNVYAVVGIHDANNAGQAVTATFDNVLITSP